MRSLQLRSLSILTPLLSLSLGLGAACVETEEAPTPPAAAAKAFTPDANATYQLVGVQSGKCVEVADGEPRAMQIRACATSARHRFKFEATGGGFYKLRNTDTNLCVDIDGQSRNDAARLMARPCADVTSQQWSLPEAAPGVVKINSRHSGKSVDVFATNTADGTNLIQWLPHDQPNQQFRVQAVPAGPPPPPEAQKPIVSGFASIDGAVTGGGEGTPVVAATLDDLNKVASGPVPRVVRVTGTISGAVTVGPNKTIEGAPEAVLRGRLAITAGGSNVIIRDLKIVGESCGKRPGCVSDTDAAIAIAGRAHHVWIDHCDLSNGGAADLIVTEGADNVTVSWTKLSHAGSDKGKRLGALIGMGKNDKGADGHLRVTFNHDWWAGNLDAAMPRVRFGQVHVYNSYFDSPKAANAVEAAADAKVVLENNSFQGGGKPHVAPSATAQIASRGNVYASEKGTRDARGEAFRPPYPYKLDDAAAVAAMVKAEAGVPHHEAHSEAHGEAHSEAAPAKKKK